ncbi:putative divalent heavy-metal cation transporter [Encephalitozoon intestinalis ATCC 50506]|uniref:Divalent heavy-metal cation transporter n=1 Tax=Encephalitozoon intestinalis (strain ATCC 50506) TaxID=876142 RepID=E0S9D5_ENCIT|nr:putative divalent heavy-metal cation transporter [Encephalitozoon intestinalis ATCC 50506]ADM12199.1 putative divalent heavy-metal cation transporter [Encephalitozoon intestinalis ATCC 50506]UTX46006.1 ZIP zinc transporter [Encephalitozoon intestinalis]
MNSQVVLFAAMVFSSSLIICLSPKVITSLKVVKRIFPFLTLLTAGFLLGVQLLELSPHMVSDCHGGKEHDHNHGHHSHESPILGFFTAGLSFIFLLAIDSIVLKHKHCEENEKKEHAHGGGCHGKDIHHVVDAKKNIKSPQISAKASSAHDSKKEGERLGCCDPSEAIKNTSSKTQVFIYILGISIHSFFEGLAFNSIDKIGSMEMGLILHKILESFALGVPLFTSGFNFSSGLILAVFYSSLTPIGIMIGSAPGFFNQTIRGIFKGLALGSIMFMVSIEMIPPMFNHPKVNRIHGILTLLAGYLTSAAVIHCSHPH